MVDGKEFHHFVVYLQWNERHPPGGKKFLQFYQVLACCRMLVGAHGGPTEADVGPTGTDGGAPKLTKLINQNCSSHKGAAKSN